MVAGSCKYQKRGLREGGINNRSSPRVSFPVTVRVGTKLVCTSESRAPEVTNSLSSYDILRCKHLNIIVKR